MSLDTTQPPLPTNASQEAGGNLDKLTALAQNPPTGPLDDDGIPYVNPNVPGADVATGDRQSQILAALQAPQPRTVTGQVTVTGPVAAAITSTALAPNAAQEMAGQMQRVGDLLEAVLLELRIHSVLLSQQGQPRPDDADTLREDLILPIN